MTRINRADSGIYNRPAQIQQPAAYVNNGSGGNANAGQWQTICTPMIHLYSAVYARGASRRYFASQLYPEARHYAEMRWRNDTVIDATMTLLTEGRRFQILGAIDPDLEHVKIVLPLVEYQAQGTKIIPQ